MLYTTNLNLKKPEQDEFYNVDDFNENADIIDEKLQEIDDKTVDGVKGSKIIHYGETSTGSATTNKWVTCEGFVLEKGARIMVKFLNQNTATVPMLNVNNTGNVIINHHGVAVKPHILSANSVHEFVYNGERFELVSTPRLYEEVGENTNGTLTQKAIGENYVHKDDIGVGTLMPTGSIIAYAGNSVPDGYMLCDGAEVNRTTYANLFTVIGTTYGAGDGSTTFSLPNLIGRFLEGASTAGAIKEAGLPNINGILEISHGVVVDGFSGAFNDTTELVDKWGGTKDSDPNYKHTITFDASASNSIYGNSDSVQPPALTMKYCIKY